MLIILRLLIRSGYWSAQLIQQETFASVSWVSASPHGQIYVDALVFILLSVLCFRLFAALVNVTKFHRRQQWFYTSLFQLHGIGWTVPDGPHGPTGCFYLHSVSTLIMSLALHRRRFTQTVQVGINTNISKSVQCVLSFRGQMIRLHRNWTWFGFIRNVVCTVLRSVLSTRLTVSQTDWQQESRGRRS